MPSPTRPPFTSSPSRDSTASGGFAAIGNMLSSPYDPAEDDTELILRTPTTPPCTYDPFINPINTSVPLPSPSATKYNDIEDGRPKIGIVRESKYQPVAKEALMKRIQSFEGELDRHGRESMYSDDSEEEGAILAFDKPSPKRPSPSTTAAMSTRQSPQTGRIKRASLVHFPQPTFVSPVKSSSPIRHAPARPRVEIPNSPGSLHPSYNQRPQQSVEAFTIPALPCSGTPVSPHLALPPLTPPRSPFAGPMVRDGPGSRVSVSSVTSESIQGYDVMKEKKALFREGQEELLTPFSPREPRQETGLRGGPRRGMNRVVSTVDFWKRFSVSVRLDQVAPAGKKESAWLNDTQSKRRSIRWLVLSVLLGIIVIAAVVAIIVVVLDNK